jgi:hypothetical protein
MHIKQILILTIICFVGVASTMLAQTPIQLFVPMKSVPKPLQVSVPSSAGMFSLQPNALQQIQNQNISSIEVQNFPISATESSNLQLEKFELMAPEGMVYLGTELGDVPVQLDNVSFFKGTIKGDKNSFVYLAVFEHYTTGFIEKTTANNVVERFVVAPVSIEKNSNQLMVVTKEDAKSRPFLCQTESLPSYDFDVYKSFQQAAEHQKNSEKSLNSKTLVCQLAIDCDNELFKAHQSNVSRAVNYVLTVVGASSALYERDVNVAFQIPYIRIWTVTDPYPATDAGMLGQFRDYWLKNMRHIPRTLAMLMSAGRYGGVAWVNTLCSNVNDGYGFGASGIGENVTYPADNYIWDIDVVSHELGHNFGSPHTHNCSWNPAIDSCYGAEGGCFTGIKPRIGTVMSYCHLTSFGTQLFFHPRVAALMRSNAELALCMYAPVGSNDSDLTVLAITDPIGGSLVRNNVAFTPTVVVKNVGNTTIPSANLTFYVSVIDTNMFTSSLQTRTQTMTALPVGQTRTITFPAMTIATNGYYQATVRALPPNDNNLVNNTKSVTFEVGATPTQTITLTNLNGGEQIQAGDSTTITWTTNITNDLRIEYTADNGISWNIIKSKTPAADGSFKWKVPVVPTTQARVKLTAFENSSVAATSAQTFSIIVGADVQPIHFEAPSFTGFTLDTAVVPQVLIKNNSSNALFNIPVRLTFVHHASTSIAYVDSIRIPSIPAGQEFLASFPAFRIPFDGMYTMTVRTLLTGDKNPSNDSMSGSFRGVAVNAAAELEYPKNKGYAGLFSNLEWRIPSDEVEEVRVQIDTTPFFSANSFEFTTTDTIISLDFLPSGQRYYWRVYRTANDFWTPIWEFYKLDWVRNPANGHYYAVANAGSSESALQFSREFSAYPLTIRSKAEQDWIAETFGNEITWLGMTDKVKEGDWRWFSGEHSKYFNWASGQPDNYNNNEHYACIRVDGGWNDINDGQLYRSILEIPLYLQPSTTSKKVALISPMDSSTCFYQNTQLVWETDAEANRYTLQIALDKQFTAPLLTTNLSSNSFVVPDSLRTEFARYYWRVRGTKDTSYVTEWSDVRSISNTKWVKSNINNNYYATTPEMNWNQAQNYARGIGANLATIRSKREVDWIDTTFNKGNFWIGFNDKKQEGQWEWVSGDTSTFTYWGQGQPDNWATIEHVAEIWSNGQRWNDADETARKVGLIELPTSAIQALETTSLFEPQKNATEVVPMVNFRWNKTNNNVMFELQYSTSPQFTNPVCIITPSTEKIVPCELNTTYYWKVRTINCFDVGTWTETFNFTTRQFPVSVIENPKGGIVAELYPNPTSGEFAVQFAKPFETVTLKLLSLQGVEVYKRSYTDVVSIPVVCNNVANGTYTLVLQTEEGTFTTSIVILK